VKLNASLQQGRGHDCDQQAVWRDVDRYLAQTGTTSPTAAFADGFCERRGGVAGALATFKPEAGQVGTAAVQRGRLLGLDVFGSRSLYARGWAKVARGILADVYDEAPAPDEHAAIRTVQSAYSERPGRRFRADVGAQSELNRSEATRAVRSWSRSPLL
jgi:hypothetical protein